MAHTHTTNLNLYKPGTDDTLGDSLTGLNSNSDILDEAVLNTALENSADLAALLSDETGTGVVVFNALPTFNATGLYVRDSGIIIKSQADSYLDIVADGGVRIGDGVPTNYTKFEADGTLQMNGSATVFNDANVGSLVLQTGGTLPGIVEWLDNDGDATGIYTRGFAVNEQGSGSIEIPHDYKEGTDLTFHVHWRANDAPSGTDNVKWQLIYSVTRSETTFPDSVTIDTGDVTYDTQYETKLSNFPAITGTNFKIGDQFNFTIKRIAAAGDAFSGEALVETLGFHYECDTIGSRTISAK